MIGLIVLSSTELIAQTNWTRKASMPTARSALAACVVDGKIYAIGGCPKSQVVYSTVEQYDPATDAWTTKTSMPTPRCFLGVGVVNGKIYAVGGVANAGWEPGLKTVEEYDPKPTVSLRRTRWQ